MEAIHREREADKRLRNAGAAEKAAKIWQEAQPAAVDHPYLSAKGISPHGLRVHAGRLVVPLRDATGALCSLQFIDADGGKRFLTGGRVAGCYFVLGKPNGVICLCEGFATAATIHEATDHAAAAGFNAGNLEVVAKALRQAFPDAKLIVCGDDDYRTEGNPGRAKAIAAAHAVDGLLAVPEFGPNRPDNATDFNDLARHRGTEAVRDAIKQARVPELATDESANAWPDLKPISAELKPVPPFDFDTLLPDPLRDWVMDEAERMPCPPDFIAIAALVALGSVIGARCRIRPKALDSWEVVPNLWGAIVGDPSAKKSPASGAAFKPLDRLIAKAVEAYRAAQSEYETARVVFDAKKDVIAGRIKEAAKKSDKGDPADIAKELRAHGDQAPEPPTVRRYKTNDSTVERLGELLRDNPVGLLVGRDELVGLLASWEREGHEGDRAFFLEAWNGNQTFDTDRIGRGHIHISNLCLSLFGGIQPDKLITYLEQAQHGLANDGMLQRIQLLVYPDPCPWEWRDRPPNKAAQDAAFAIFEIVADFDPAAWGAAPTDDSTKSPYFHFSDDAQAVFIEWSDDLHRVRMPNENEPFIQQHLSKYDKLFPALALVFHLVDCAANGGSGPVTRETALRAAAWCKYLEAHARRCYGLLKDDGLRAAQALAVKLERRALKDGFTLRDVRRNQWRGLTTDSAIKAALDWLEDEGWLRSEATGGIGPGAGRRTVRYRIHPTLKGKCTGAGT